jgi:hypothetical protein
MRSLETMTPRRYGATVACVGVLVAMSGELLRPAEVDRIRNPTGAYVAAIKRRPIYGMLATMPGHGSGSPGFVEIQDARGVSYGEMPVLLLYMAHTDFAWSADSAEIPLVGRWSFATRSCHYWNAAQTAEIDCSP